MARRLVLAFWCYQETPAQHWRFWDSLSARMTLSWPFLKPAWHMKAHLHIIIGACRVQCADVIKYLEALPPPHWSVLSLPLSGQRSDFPGASVKLQHHFHGLLPPQANLSFLPHFLVIKDVLHVRGTCPRWTRRADENVFFAFSRPLSSWMWFMWICGRINKRIKCSHLSGCAILTKCFINTINEHSGVFYRHSTHS